MVETINVLFWYPLPVLWIPPAAVESVGYNNGKHFPFSRELAPSTDRSHLHWKVALLFLPQLWFKANDLLIWWYQSWPPLLQRKKQCLAIYIQKITLQNTHFPIHKQEGLAKARLYLRPHASSALFSFLSCFHHLLKDFSWRTFLH